MDYLGPVDTSFDGNALVISDENVYAASAVYSQEQNSYNFRLFTPLMPTRQKRYGTTQTQVSLALLLLLVKTSMLVPTLRTQQDRAPRIPS